MWMGSANNGMAGLDDYSLFVILVERRKVLDSSRFISITRKMNWRKNLIHGSHPVQQGDVVCCCWRVVILHAREIII